MRFSFTRLATYRRCPFQYKLRYQHHLPGQPRPGTRLGVALHAALATFYRDRRPVPWPDDLLAAFDAQWPTDLLERDVRAMDEGRALLVDYFRRQGDTWPAVRLIEAPFRLELGRYTLVGTLDRVDELPDGTLRIVDYKTARTPPQTPDTFQLDVYQLGWPPRLASSPRRLPVNTCATGYSRWWRSMIATCGALWSGWRR